MKNINKGIDTFNNAVQSFGGSMDQLSKDLGGDTERQSTKDKENLEKIWGKESWTSPTNVKIWSDSSRELESQRQKDKINLEKIWGKRK